MAKVLEIDANYLLLYFATDQTVNLSLPNDSFFMILTVSMYNYYESFQQVAGQNYSRYESSLQVAAANYSRYYGSLQAVAANYSWYDYCQMVAGGNNGGGETILTVAMYT